MRVEEVPIGDDVKALISKQMGVTELYPIQEMAVRAGVLEGESLLLSAPTASGKTLVPFMRSASIFENGKGKVLYLVPLRALAYEKYLEFGLLSRISKPSRAKTRIGISTGDYDSPATELAPLDFIVATYEKIDSIIRHRPSWLKQVSLLVFDEIHLITSVDRGPVVEMLVSWAQRIFPGAQRLALSATVSNDSEIASWLGCKLTRSDWRPVPLFEGIFKEDCITYDQKKEEIESKFGDELMDLVNHSLKEEGQILLFAPTRRQAVALAKKLAPVPQLQLNEKEAKKLEQLAEQINAQEDMTPLGRDLALLVRSGASFHHAGLPTSQRRIVENGFKDRLIKIIAATPTLAAGVNLPARVVCLTSISRYSSAYGPNEISVMEYKQMAGRAGRPQFDKYGLSLIRARERDEIGYLLEHYITAPIEPVRSMLGQSDYFSSAVLSTCAAGLAEEASELEAIFSSTLLARQRGEKYVQWKSSQTIDYLKDKGALKVVAGNLKVTPFGRRISELYVLPETAFMIVDRLSVLPREVTDVTLLHVVVGTPDIEPMLASSRHEMDTLVEFMEKHTGELFPFEAESAAFDEVKCLMTLKMWAEESSSEAIYERLRVEPGDLHVLSEKAAWLLYAASELAQWSKSPSMTTPARKMSTRVRYGVKEELLNLISIAGVGRARARTLFKAGIKSRSQIAKMSVEDLMRIPGIGTKLAISLKQQAGGTIKKRSFESEDLRQARLFDYTNQ